MIIGLISDTHGLLRPEIARVFAGVDRILHAGDVGKSAVLDGLEKIAPVAAVFGNVDDPHDPALARVRTLAHNGIVTRLPQSLLRKRPGEGLHPRVPVDDPVVGVHHVDGVARADLDQTPDRRRKLSYLFILVHHRPIV